jgi:hypothetical protein
LEWCRTFPQHEDALWRLTQLGTNLLLVGIEGDVVLTAETVLADLLAPTSRPKNVTRGLITTLFSYLIESSQMQMGSLRERVDLIFLKWLKHPQSFGNDPKAHRTVQRITFLKRLSALITGGALDLKDIEALRRFIRWLDTWEMERKQLARPVLSELKAEYPANELWDTIRFEE